MRDLESAQKDFKQYPWAKTFLDEHLGNCLLAGYPQTILHDIVKVDFIAQEVIDYRTGMVYKMQDMDPEWVARIRAFTNQNQLEQIHLNDLTMDILSVEFPEVFPPVIRPEQSHSSKQLQEAFAREMVMLCQMEKLVGNILDKDTLLHVVHSQAFNFEYADELHEAPVLEWKG